MRRRRRGSEIRIADVDEATYQRSLSNYITDLIEETTLRIESTRRLEAVKRARSEAEEESRLWKAERKARREVEDQARMHAEAGKRAEEDTRKRTESADERLRERFRNP